MLFRSWSESSIVQRGVAQLPWSVHVVLLDKFRDHGQREWYARQALAHAWSRPILLHHIETRLHERQGRAITNFAATLPAEQARRAVDLFKDPYLLDFITLDETARERELEKALIERIRDFLLELGTGFAFIGSQYRIAVADRKSTRLNSSHIPLSRMPSSA